MHDIFLGRQPILDRQQSVVAYELLFRDSALSHASVIEEVSKASFQVIANTFSSMGVDAVLGGCRGFFNVDSDVLMTDMIEALPCDRVTLEILETIEVDESVIRRCRQLRERGFVIALDDYVPGDQREAMLDVSDCVKVDLVGLSDRELRRLVNRLGRWPVQLLAEKVETQTQFELCRRLGFELFQGYFFARPMVLQGGSLDSGRAALMELMRHVTNEEGEARVVDTLKRNVNLSVNLLKVVNAAAMPTRTRINVIEDALHYLGRRQLQRWVAILLFAGGDESGLRDPLFQMASRRGRLMELIIERAPDGGDASAAASAFLVGMLSLVGALLAKPIEDALADLNLDAEIEAALIERSGPFGQLLRLVERLEVLERGDYDRIAHLLDDFGLEMADLQQIDLETHAWVHGLVDHGA